MNRCRGCCRAALVLLLGALPAGKTAPQAAAADEKHWAFVPVQRPRVPAVRDNSWPANPIDAFILAALEKKRIKPAPAVDRRTLLRRVYLDLIGVRPSPRETQAFLDDQSPHAYARVVDDLLARPQYGQRWARHWLDVVRYAETNGYERDGAKPSAWRYRDYVINAFNGDKPYDRFVLEQIAGDELADVSAESQIATTFLRLGTWDDEPAEPLIDRYDQLDDVLGTTATAFLGITLRCARCHNHKFEPFTQKDYYRMLAVFEPLKRPQKGRTELDRPVGSAGELSAHRAARVRIDVEAAAVTRQITTLEEKIVARLSSRLPKSSRPGKSLPRGALVAFQTSPGQRTKQQQALVKKFAARINQEILAAATDAEKAHLRIWEQQLTRLKATKLNGLPRAYIWYENGPKAPLTHVLRRGDPHRPLAVVGPGLPGILVAKQPEPPKPLAHSTGRRLWLARWMTRLDNPLVARVMVNRIWQHHFGAGLVTSANDFGVMGEAPTHPELLDWLAADFMAGGWRIKRLHRLIVMSSTYRTSATNDPAAARVDPGVQLLWRWKQRRLEAEAVRDSVLAVSGRLNPQLGGPSIYPPLPRAVLEGQSRPGDGWGKSDERQASRRSVYIFVKRVLAVPELELLDAPDTTSSCEQRLVSTTAPQALTFLNGDFIQQQALAFAGRLLREAGSDPPTQVRRAFELALCRSPRPEELRIALAFLVAQEKQIQADAGKGKLSAGAAHRKALQGFCLVMLNTNEFVYVN